MRAIRICLAAGLTAMLLAIGSPASASSTAYAFRLTSPNTAIAPVGDEHCQAGDWISITGSGQFDVAAGTVEASGKFTHYGSDGSIHAQGKWAATGLTSFTDAGGPKPGRHGGTLVLVVTHFHDGMAHTGLTMTVTSSIDASDGYGSTVGPFTDRTGGDSVFAIQ